MMATILVLGAGMNGLALAMLLAKDGHDVTVLERDANEPVDDPEEAWKGWERRGVGQFRMLHSCCPGGAARSKPSSRRCSPSWRLAVGCASTPSPACPTSSPAGFRPGDERFETVTARRPVLEGAVAAAARRRQECGSVAGSGDGLSTNATADTAPPRSPAWSPSTTGRSPPTWSSTGGRRSALPSWLEAIDARQPIEERDDSGFVYYGRHFRSADGSVPPCKNKILTHHDSLSILTLPADNGTWGVGFVTSASDKELRRCAIPRRERALAEYPMAAHWMDGSRSPTGRR